PGCVRSAAFSLSRFFSMRLPALARLCSGTQAQDEPAAHTPEASLAPARARHRYTPRAGRLVIATDFARRGQRIIHFDRLHALGYAATALVSLLFWALFLSTASRRRGFASKAMAGLFVLIFGLVIGVEGAFRAIWNNYLSLESQPIPDPSPGRS